jgi:hypothetical protein
MWRVPQFLDERCEATVRVHRLRGEPDGILLWLHAQRRFLLFVVPSHVDGMTPRFSIFAERWPYLVVHWAGAGHIVVFADEIGERNREVSMLNVVHAEAIPRGCPVSSAFILLAKDMHPKVRLAYLLDATQRSSLERRAKGYFRTLQRGICEYPSKGNCERCDLGKDHHRFPGHGCLVNANASLLTTR